MAVQRYRLGLGLYQEAQIDQAASEFEVALGMFPGSAKLLYNLGRCYERLGRFDDAAGVYERYVVAAPDAPDRAQVVQLATSLRERA